jgi:UDP-N-acetylmuramoyl-L-alanyl-D-glutamate--2,6-diaminopimelate ligase
VLSELRGGTRGRLIALFGQAGHRDVANREAMVRAVSAHADLAIVTSDDPYDEDPNSIVDDLGGAFDRLGWVEGTQYWRIVDRVDAIRFAIERAKPEDCVLLAGRGAEDTTVIGNRRIELDDRAVASTALATRSR